MPLGGKLIIKPSQCLQAAVVCALGARLGGSRLWHRPGFAGTGPGAGRSWLRSGPRCGEGAGSGTGRPRGRSGGRGGSGGRGPGGSGRPELGGDRTEEGTSEQPPGHECSVPARPCRRAQEGSGLAASRGVPAAGAGWPRSAPAPPPRVRRPRLPPGCFPRRPAPRLALPKLPGPRPRPCGGHIPVPQLGLGVR